MEYTFDVQRLTNNFNHMNRFNTVNLVWKGNESVRGLCSAYKTGHGSTLFDKLNPISYEDFYYKLKSYAENNKNTLSVYERGLTSDELHKIAVNFKNGVEKHDRNIVFTLENYIDYILYVNVIQTFDGHINEVMLVDYINKYWYKDAHRVTGSLDSQYGIDIMYRGDTRGIQVKSIKFFFGNKSSVVTDRKNIKPLKDEVMQKFGIDMWYAIYDRDNKSYLISSNGTPVFSFEEFNQLLNTKVVPHPVLSYKQICL